MEACSAGLKEGKIACRWESSQEGTIPPKRWLPRGRQHSADVPRGGNTNEGATSCPNWQWSMC